MQITIEVADTKADFVLELLKSLPFVDIQLNQSNAVSGVPDNRELFSPKTTRLLGSFPQLAGHDDREIRQQAVQAKHLK